MCNLRAGAASPYWRVVNQIDDQRRSGGAMSVPHEEEGMAVAKDAKTPRLRSRRAAANGAATNKGGDEPAVDLSNERLTELYRQMVLIRRFEEKCAESYAYGKIGGFCHLYIGEEAVAVGAIAALSEEDHIVSHYRDHGYALARGC